MLEKHTRPSCRRAPFKRSRSLHFPSRSRQRRRQRRGNKVSTPVIPCASDDCHVAHDGHDAHVVHVILVVHVIPVAHDVHDVHVVHVGVTSLMSFTSFTSFGPPRTVSYFYVFHYFHQLIEPQTQILHAVPNTFLKQQYITNNDDILKFNL